MARRDTAVDDSGGRVLEAETASSRWAEPAGESGLFEFTQVAFAGHNRAGDIGDKVALAAALRKAFAMLAEAGVREARLLTGLARGADVLAARAWQEADLGPVHAVFPFLTDKPAPGAAELMEQGTWLDGEASHAAGRNPYLAQTRWLLGNADLLVTAWTGKSARGAGGTADAVRLALEHGIPVLWIQPGSGNGPRLIRPEQLQEDFGFLEFLEQLATVKAPLVEPADPERLRSALTDLGLALPPTWEDAAAVLGGPESPRPAQAYRLFRRILGGRPTSQPQAPAPEALEVQPGFERLSRAHAHADAWANRLGALHRSHQVILLAVAILAATAGSASALWPTLKNAMVAVELGLAVVALLMWWDSEKGRRHQRWSTARRLAEDLRLERAAWALGVSTAPHGLNLTSTEAARHERRLAGLPTGAYDDGRVATWGHWAMDQLVAGQAAYHRGQGVVSGRISHRVHVFENAALVVLLVIMLSYLVTAGALALVGRDAPHWLGGVVIMAGAVVPAISAAGLALEATLSLSEDAQRSAVLAQRLDALMRKLPPNPGLDEMQNVAKAAIRLQRAQEDHWTEGAVRRRMVRGG